MSASEKLKALETEAQRMSAGHGHAYVPYYLISALPQIVAVVEAAEFYLQRSTSGQDAMTLGIEQTLAALDEALS